MKTWVEGKRVAFVGLAPNIENKALGEEINNFDIVIRTNYFPLPKVLQNDYGSKCDIMTVLDDIYRAKIKKIIHTFK